jgi:hypothetical protein
VGPLGVALLLALAACTTTAPSDDKPAGQQRVYRDVVELFDHGIARTCALNGGVCHNSNNYPDLHTVSNLIGTVGRACNVDTAQPENINDACEPAADHLVIAAAGIDARILRASVTSDLARVTLVLDPPPTALASPADSEVHRATAVLVKGVRVAAVDATGVTLTLATPEAKRFFDVRAYPVGPLQLRVGDPNGNGIEGARAVAMPLITPGDPDHSYLLKRLVDLEYGELMPRQCRTWDDAANEALACWISGLAADASNAYAPIDYDACTVDVHGLGKCESQ